MAHTTSLTLLERLQSPQDDEAWHRFARLYTPLLYYWCRRAGLQEQDAADLVQEVFVVLVRKLPEFRYDRERSFRNWLRTVTLNKWRECRRRRNGHPAADEIDIEQLPANPEAWFLDETEYRRQLVASALPLIEHEFSPREWQAFRRHAVDGQPAADVAAELGLRIGTVYAAKSHVLSRLRQELAGFLEDGRD